MNALTVVTQLTQLTSALLTLSTRLQSASQALQRAHLEGWVDQDPRWDQVWDEADTELQKALARLKA
jgi:hypothetical protein